MDKNDEYAKDSDMDTDDEYPNDSGLGTDDEYADDSDMDTDDEYANDSDIEWLDDYIYEALEQPNKTIRLLEIISISPHTRCKLIVVPLDDRPEYTTLSYVWGDSSDREHVDIEGQKLQITSSLANALRDVYGQFKNYPTDTNGRQWLWADGICINQADEDEKNHQVPLMHDVYSKCTRMFSWLGREDDRCRRNMSTTNGETLDAINLVSTEISKLPGYDLFMSGFDHNNYLSDDALIEYRNGLERESGEEFTDLAWLRRYYSEIPDFDLFRDAIFFKMVRFFQTVYWSRLWILQEVVLAPSTILLCGPKTASWATICRVFTWTRLVKMHYHSSVQPSFIPGIEWLRLMDCGRIPQPFALVAGLKSGQATSTADAQQVRDHHSLTLHGTEFRESSYHLLGLDTYLHAYRYQATDSKDFIYSMSAVTGYQVIPDYSSATSTAEVYQRFTEDYIDAAKDAIVKGRQPLDSDVLWFLNLAGVGFEWGSTRDLPSWVPDFAGASEAYHRDHDETFEIPHFASGFNNEIMGIGDMPSIEGSTLHCLTIIFDRVRHLGPQLLTRRSLDWQGHQADWQLKLLDYVLDSRAEGRTSAGFDLFRIICELMSAKGKLSTDKSARFLEIVVANMLYLCATFRGLERAELAAQLCKELSPSQTEDLLKRSDWSFTSGYMDWEGVGARSADIELYLVALKAANKLCPAITDLGYVGLLPTLAQVGDLVGFIKGYSVPVILRKSGDGYAFVGPCQMSGNMEGQVAEMLRDGRARMEKIKIY